MRRPTLSDQRCDDGAQGGDAVALFRRGEDDFGEGGGVFGQAFAHLGQDAITIFGFDLVGFGEHALEGDGGAVQQGHDFLVYFLDAVAGVDQDEGAAQILAAMENDDRRRFLGWPEKLFVVINGILPKIVDKAMLKQLPVIRRFLNPGVLS